MLLFFPRKYGITEKNTIEFYHLFGRSEKRSIPLQDIVEIITTQNRLCFDYKKEGVSHPLTFALELSDTDMIEVKNELLNRNPKIEIS